MNVKFFVFDSTRIIVIAVFFVVVPVGTCACGIEML